MSNSKPNPGESLADQFRASWKSGQPSSIEALVAQATQKTDEETLLGLIKIEMDARRERGESPSVDEYATRFPDLDRFLLADLLTLPAPPPVDLSGPLLPARYRPLKQLGSGGIGIVWRVYDKTLERPLAVKVLHEKFRNDPAANARLDREALVTGLLQHPGVPPIHDRGKLVTGSSFFAMKLVDGETLAEILARSNIREQRMQLMGIFEQIARTMAYAHSQKIVHRDLKPANVMVGEFGEVQVMDWGLAKVLDAKLEHVEAQTPDEGDAKSHAQNFENLAETVVRTQDSSISEPQRDLTRQGDVIGTPSYMAPEQATGNLAKIGPASDVFSLGAILLELLTGKPLYAEVPIESLVTTAKQGLVESSLERLNPLNIDRDLVELTRECLAREPDHRPKDGNEVAARVTQYLHSVESRLRESELSIGKAEVKFAEERKRKRLAFGLFATIVAAILVGTIGYLWFQIQSEKQAAANLKSQTRTMVVAIGSAPPEELAASISNLKPFGQLAKDALLLEIENADEPDLKTRYAIALSQFQDLRIPLLVEQLQTTSAAMVPLIVGALQKDSETSREELANAYQATDQRDEKARLALAALSVNDDTLAKKLILESHSRQDLNNQRFALIAAFRQWTGPIDPLWRAFVESEHPAVRYTLLASLAEVPPNSVAPDELTSIATQLTKSYADEKSASIRALGELVLGRWEQPLPKLKPNTEPDPGFEWYSNSLGTIMVKNKIALGKNDLEYDYFISDREVTADLFQQFIDDDVEAARRKILPGRNGLGRSWQDQTFKDVVEFAIDISRHHGKWPASESPMTAIGYYTALRFCNWMSRKDGLEPYYINLDPELEKSTVSFDPRAENWIKNHGANGYRLPSQTEYHQAAVADSGFQFESIDPEYHDFVGWYSKNAAEHQRVAGRLPNSLGLFDLYGNLSEVSDLNEFNSGRLYWEFGGSYESPTLHFQSKPGAWPSPTITSGTGSGMRVARMTDEQIRTRAGRDPVFALRVEFSETLSVDDPDQLKKLIDQFSALGLKYLDRRSFSLADLCFTYSRQIATRLIEKDVSKAEMLVLRGGDAVNSAIAFRAMRLFEPCYLLLDDAEKDLQAAIKIDKDVKFGHRFLANKGRVLFQVLSQHAGQLSTDVNPNRRDGKKAIRLATMVVEQQRDENSLAILAAAYAEDKNFDKAVEIQQQVIALLEDADDRVKMVHRRRLKMFQEKKPLRFRQ